MAEQTVSAPVRELGRSLGYALLKPVGRSLTLTEARLAASADFPHSLAHASVLLPTAHTSMRSLLATRAVGFTQRLGSALV